MGQVRFAHRFFIYSHPPPYGEGDMPFFVGGTGYVVKYEKEYVFVTAAHAVGMLENQENYRVHNAFLLMPDPAGGARVIRLIEFVKPITHGSGLECEDIGVFRIHEGDGEYIIDYLDNSFQGKTITTDKFLAGDEMVLGGFPFIPNTEPVNFEDKRVSYKPLDIFLRYGRSEESINIHMGMFDHEMNRLFSTDTSILDGISGSVVLLKRDFELTWAGMVISAGGDQVRFIDANFIDQYIYQRVLGKKT